MHTFCCLDSTLYWTENPVAGSSSTLYHCPDEGIPTPLFTPRPQRSVDRPCNCSVSSVGVVLALDHTKGTELDILFYDSATNQISATDRKGCHCRTITRNAQGFSLLSGSFFHWYSDIVPVLHSTQMYICNGSKCIIYKQWDLLTKTGRHYFQGFPPTCFLWTTWWFTGTTGQGTSYTPWTRSRGHWHPFQWSAYRAYRVWRPMGHISNPCQVRPSDKTYCEIILILVGQYWRIYGSFPYLWRCK